MNYEFRYRLAEAPKATDDGSQIVKHDIWAIYREQGAAPTDPWIVLGNRHKDINVPGGELLIVLQGPDVVGKYKTTLANNLNTQPVPIRGWDLASLERMMDNNDIAAQAAADANAWITVTMGLTYPVDFSV